MQRASQKNNNNSPLGAYYAVLVEKKKHLNLKLKIINLR